MTKKEILEKFADYCAMEFRDTVTAVNSGWGDRKDIVKCGLQRCLGIAMFIQEFDIPFDTVDEIYTSYREKFEKLF